MYVQISEEEITFLTGGDDPYDDDVVLKKLFHRNLKLLIVTEGSKGCRYYTKVCFPYQFEYDVTCLVGCIISHFIFGLFYAAVCTCVHRQRQWAWTWHYHTESVIICENANNWM